MSVRPQFRSQDGCCICGTKSSTSRFTDSTRFSQHFAECFGAKAAGRRGDLCNACVLSVKRWLKKSPDQRTSKRFMQVVDKKKGPGPKHMKQITKRQRRREARNGANSTCSSASSSCGGTSMSAGSGATRMSEGGMGNGMDTISRMNSPVVGYRSPIQASTPSCGSSGSMSISSFALSGASSSGVCEDGTFRVPDANCGAPRRSHTKYKRRVTMPPIKMPINADEVDQLLREIMAQNSEAVNFDSREMHMAVQNKLRLRSRTVPTNLVDHNSVSSGSMGSSIGNVDNLRN